MGRRFSRGSVIRDLIGPLIGLVFECLTQIREARADGEVTDEEITDIVAELSERIAEMVLDHVR